MKIRIATHEDRHVVLRMIDALIEELGGSPLTSKPAEEASVVFLSNQENGIALIAEERQQVIGVCTLTFQNSIRTLGKYAIIQEMFVIPESRQRNHGAAIVERAIREARSRGCAVVELGTPPNGGRQEKFYESIGFRQVGARLRYSVSVS